MQIEEEFKLIPIPDPNSLTYGDKETFARYKISNVSTVVFTVQ